MGSALVWRRDRAGAFVRRGSAFALATGSTGCALPLNESAPRAILFNNEA